MKGKTKILKQRWVGNEDFVLNQLWILSKAHCYPLSNHIHENIMIIFLELKIEHPIEQSKCHSSLLPLFKLVGRHVLAIKTN